MRAILLDTGVVVALLDRSERMHAACVAAIGEAAAPLVTCEPVIAESCYLLRGLSGAAEAIQAEGLLYRSVLGLADLGLG